MKVSMYSSGKMRSGLVAKDEEVHFSAAMEASSRPGYRRATVAGRRVVGLDHRAQRCPWDDLPHGREKHIALRRASVLLVLRIVVSGHGKGCFMLNSMREPCQRWTGSALPLAAVSCRSV